MSTDRHGHGLPRRRLQLLRRLYLTAAVGGALVLVVATAALIRVSTQQGNRTTASSAKSEPSGAPQTGVPRPEGRGFQLSTGSASPSPSASANAVAGSGPPASVAGWKLVYSTDFAGNSLPPGWGTYQGQPGGDPNGLWSPADVAVSGGELHLLATPSGSGGYATGGVSFSGNPQAYGIYLVRLKGDYEPDLQISDIALLWPAGSQWPPEIDFYEDNGGARTSYLATVHPGPSGDNSHLVHETLKSDATAWHTYGVIWTPSTITFTVDGQQVGNAVYSSNLPAWPDIAMNLDLQSENLGPAQPSQSIETMTVDWVAEYTMS
jgi:beta-glucanase (GH16 family)